MQDARKSEKAYFVYRVYTERNDGLEQNLTTRAQRGVDTGHIHPEERLLEQAKIVILLGKKEDKGSS